VKKVRGTSIIAKMYNMANKECKSLNLLGFHGSFIAYTATTAPNTTIFYYLTYW